MRQVLLWLLVLLSAGLTACSDSHSSESSTARGGALLYRQYCSQCHAGGSHQAPRVGMRFSADWLERLQHKDREALIQAAIHGQGRMPARGLCLDCSDEEIRETVGFMLRISGVD